MDELIDDVQQIPIRVEAVGRVVENIVTADSRVQWIPGEELDLGSKRWRPSAVSQGSETRLLYVCLQEEIPRFVAERISLAAARGIRVTVALMIPTLFSEQVIEVLTDVDSDVYVIDDYQEDRRYRARHLLAAIADVGVPIEPNLRKSMARKIWSRIDEGTNNQKGRRLEAFLSFLFSQVLDLRVVERNYRNESEEIDLVVQVDNFSNRAWQKPGVPFILVESKNTQDKSTQYMVSTMLTKLQTKRGSAKIGIMVCPSGFTEAARLQELRFSTQDLCIAMVDTEDILRLIEVDDLDGALEAIVRRSLLR
ncbi:MAG TPA: hypothetical protein VFV67_36350 [Actinophytocola sp.]|uniref:hypothetical protein n=1 Tax=Actinophytocola sp. TaxID=1872138 RepID=UPI002DBE57FF|nr:hypothetical protein [Actinophytocola sp.]HEU5476130.1 hypothetical protein [Actinophytocola sp.]